MFAETKFFHKAGEGSGGGGGGDSHNKGSFLTPEALRTAYPTAEPGDFAIVESTDTIWVWDNDGSAWKDADQKGQVTSVNNQTGAVTLDINDVAPTQTGHSGRVLGTDGFVAGWVKPEIVQVSALPTASEDEVGNIYQFVGTTDANYTNGYFYKCVSDGQDPATYSWTQTDVQPAPSGGGSTALSLTLVVANWSNNSITVTATGVTASNNVIVSPAPASQSAYTAAGVICTAQATDSLTFTCTTTPSSDLTVTVLII